MLLSPHVCYKTVEEEFPVVASADVPKTITRGEVEVVMLGIAKTDVPKTDRF